MKDEPLLGLTTASRAAIFGLTYRAQLELEIDEPWVRDWSARFDGGGENLRAWVAAGRPSEIDLAELRITGDSAFASSVRAVVAKFPAAVRFHLVAKVTIANVLDLDIPGRFSASMEMELRSAADETTIAHEAGHAFHRRPPAMWAGLDAEQRARIFDSVCLRDVEQGLVGEHIAQAMQHERAADRLASLWLGYTVDTTSARDGEFRRMRKLGEIAEAAARARAREEAV